MFVQLFLTLLRCLFCCCFSAAVFVCLSLCFCLFVCSLTLLLPFDFVVVAAALNDLFVSFFLQLFLCDSAVDLLGLSCAVTLVERLIPTAIVGGMKLDYAAAVARGPKAATGVELSENVDVAVGNAATAKLSQSTTN